MARLLVPVVVALLSIIAYRGRYVIPNILLSDPALPFAYYASGPASTHCEQVRAPGMSFCEDASFWDTLDVSDKLAQRHVILSCDPHRKQWNTVLGPLANPEPRGSLWVYRTDGRSAPQEITLENYPAGHDFHPLGIAVTPSRLGVPSTLLVVNHARDQSTVEQFTLSPNAPTRATWVRTLRSPYFVAPNSIALTSESPLAFYLSNDHLFTRRLPAPLGAILALAETYLGIPTSWVGHVTLPDSDPSVPSYTLAALGINYANGVAVSPSGETVAVASTARTQILFYTRDPSTNALVYRERVLVPFAPDNLHFDSDGGLYVAGHPHTPSVEAVARNVTGARSASWVAVLSPRAEGAEVSGAWDVHAPVSTASKVPPSKTWEVETLYQTNGEGFMTATTAMRDEKTGSLYVSGLYEDGLLVCSP